MNSEFAKSQVMRLSGLDFFPPQAEGVRELIRALAKHAKSDAHARAIIDWWLEHNAKCPKPSDFKAAAGEVAEATGTPLPPFCTNCASSDWIHTTLRRTNRLSRQIEDISAMVRCGCPRGQALAKRDAQHQDETAKPVKRALAQVGEILGDKGMA